MGFPMHAAPATAPNRRRRMAADESAAPSARAATAADETGEHGAELWKRHHECRASHNRLGSAGDTTGERSTDKGENDALAYLPG